MTELVIRFVLGGLVVSLFAAIGELWEPKTFAGLFGAAPSVALGTLGITYVTSGAGAVAEASRWMLVGAIAMFAYGACCVVACKRREVSIVVGAFAPWLVWAAVAAGLWFALRGVVIA